MTIDTVIGLDIGTTTSKALIRRLDGPGTLIVQKPTGWDLELDYIKQNPQTMVRLLQALEQGERFHLPLKRCEQRGVVRVEARQHVVDVLLCVLLAGLEGLRDVVEDHQQDSQGTQALDVLTEARMHGRHRRSGAPSARPPVNTSVPA